MNSAAAMHTVLAALSAVAPEAETTTLLPDVELREQLDIDSVDFLEFVEQLAARTGHVIPERDYAQLLTLDSCVAYLQRRDDPGEHAPAAGGR